MRVDEGSVASVRHRAHPYWFTYGARFGPPPTPPGMLKMQSAIFVFRELVTDPDDAARLVSGLVTLEKGIGAKLDADDMQKAYLIEAWKRLRLDWLQYNADWQAWYDARVASGQKTVPPASAPSWAHILWNVLGDLGLL